MSTRIALVDFDAQVACLVVKPTTGSGPSTRVHDIVVTLRTAGIQQIHVYLDASQGPAAAVRLRSTLGAAGATIHEGGYDGAVGRHGNRAFQCSVDPDEALPGWTIEACFDSVEDAVTRSALLVALARLATNMKTTLGGRLRFAVHELVANAADHAQFARGEPRIELAIMSTPSSTLLSYRDNAGPFATTAPPDIDVNLKIARGERRGLGLFMLNRMAQQLRYRRNGDWNETTVLFVESGGTIQSTRSVVMEGLKLEQTPCRIPNTVVLKPIGSIDSTTVYIIDAKLNALAAQKGVQVVVDMSSVDFVSSAGVGVFLGTVAQLRAGGGDLVFLGMTPAILEVFEIINLSAYFKIVNSLDELQHAMPR